MNSVLIKDTVHIWLVGVEWSMRIRYVYPSSLYHNKKKSLFLTLGTPRIQFDKTSKWWMHKFV